MYLACEDGTIKLAKVKKEKIELVKHLPKINSNCLSLAVDIVEGNVKYLFSGYADSSMRKWELESANSILQWQKQGKKAAKGGK